MNLTKRKCLCSGNGRLGDKVVVSVAKVDRMMGTIDFVFEEENEDFQE